MRFGKVRVIRTLVIASDPGHEPALICLLETRYSYRISRGDHGYSASLTLKIGPAYWRVRSPETLTTSGFRDIVSSEANPYTAVANDKFDGT